MSSTSIASDAAIEIQADDVVVDPGGYNVTGTAGSTSNTVGIRGIDVHNVRITNETVRGFRNGINLFFSASGGGQTQPTNHVIDHVTAANKIPATEYDPTAAALFRRPDLRGQPVHRGG